MLRDEGDLECVGVARTGEEAVRRARELLPDVVVLDVALPKINAIEAIRQIKRVRRTTAVVVLSAYGYDPYVSPSFEAGAADYLLKNIPLRQMVDRIRALCSGETSLSWEITERVLRSLAGARETSVVPGEALSPKELEVLKLATKGLSNSEIASRINEGEATVREVLSSIFGKLEVSSRAEAILEALREGRLTPDDLP